MSWTYEEDIIIIQNKGKTAKQMLEILPNKSLRQIRYRQNQYKDKTLEDLNRERNFIIENFETLSLYDIASELGISTSSLHKRIYELKSEGVIVDKKPKVAPTTYKKKIRDQRVKIYDYSKVLSKNRIQQDVLEVGKEYIISKKRKGDKIKKSKLKVIGVYDNYYLLEDKQGRKHTLMKVDYHLKNWEYDAIDSIK